MCGKLSDGPLSLQKQIKMPPTEKTNTVWRTFMPIVQQLKTKIKQKADGQDGSMQCSCHPSYK